MGETVVVSFPFAVAFVDELRVSFVEVEFCLMNGSGGSKISSSISPSSSSPGFSSGSREPVVILTRGLECNRTLMGAMSRLACTIVFPFRGKSTDIVGCFET